MAKSAYERGLNHLTDRKSLDLGSHMLKHAVSCHQGEDPQKIDFHMKVLAYHKSSFERQIDEHVDVVEVEICAATEVEIIKNVQLNSQVRGEISVRG